MMQNRIDDFLPSYDFSEKHAVRIKSTPEQSFELIQTIDFSQSRLVRMLFWLRGLKHARLGDFQDNFCLLAMEPSREIALGLIGRPWQMQGGIIRCSKEDFLAFNTPGYAKMVWNFTFEPVGDEISVSTETRIFCTDDVSKSKFRIYWFFIKPFSGLIRKEMLRLLKTHLEKN